MALDKLYNFIKAMNGLEREVKLELPNYPVPFKLARINKDQLENVIDYLKIKIIPLLKVYGSLTKGLGLMPNLTNSI